MLSGGGSFRPSLLLSKEVKLRVWAGARLKGEEVTACFWGSRHWTLLQVGS